MIKQWSQRLFGRGHYRIDDPRPIAAASPYTYFLPSDVELGALTAGDNVKLIFEAIPSSEKWGAERMWVSITDTDGDDLTGELLNAPLDIASLKPGDQVRFKRWQVIGIEWAEYRLLPPPPAPERRDYWDRCFVDQQILDGRLRVEFLYREEPDPPQEGSDYSDSGWRIRCDSRGLTDEECEFPQCSHVAIGAVLNNDDSWVHLIDAPVGSAFLRDWDSGEFHPAEMPPIDDADADGR